MKNLIVLLLLLCGTAFGQTVTDIDGNVYSTKVYSSKTWMTENLKVTRLNDGTAILKAPTNKFPLVYTPQYAKYDTAPNNTYGAYYNWYVVNTGKLCPTGWSVPTTTDWQNLATSVGGSSIAGNMLKSATGWDTISKGTNSSGWKGLPAGYAATYGIYDNGNWWSSTITNDTTAKDCAYYGRLYAAGKEIQMPFLMKQYGISVRCVK